MLIKLAKKKKSFSETWSNLAQAGPKHVTDPKFLLLLPHLPNDGIIGIHHHTWFYVVLKMEGVQSLMHTRQTL